ncbi:MAG: hypothetical protein AAGH15_18940 [Myxococcota bacterium]
MPDVTLASLHDQLWLTVALPALALAGLVLTIRGRGPQWRRFGAGLRALGRPGEGVGHGLAGTLGALGSFGAATAIGTATAVSLGGAGVLPYVWLFGILVAPVRWGETLLAGTDAPGRGDAAASGSLPRRLLRMGDRFRVAGVALLLLTLATAFAWAGAAHAAAAGDAAGALLEADGAAFAYGALALGALLAIFALASPKGTALLGWVAIVALLTVLGAGLWAVFADPAATFAVLGRAFGDAMNGAEAAGPFTGALAGEIATAAALHALAPQAASTGVEGSAQALGGGVKAQAAAAAVLPLVQAIVATALVMAFVGSGAYRTRVEMSRPMIEGRVYTMAVATANDRSEPGRLYQGFMRIVGGEPRNPQLSFGFERGMVEDPVYELDDEPANVGMEARDGLPFRLMVSGSPRSLEPSARKSLSDLRIRGKMLPTKGSLYAAAFVAAGGDLASKLALVALLALAVVGLAFWGVGAGRALPTSLPAPLALAAGALPAIGGALAVSGALPRLLSVGGILAACLVAATSLLLILRSREITKLGG